VLQNYEIDGRYLTGVTGALSMFELIKQTSASAQNASPSIRRQKALLASGLHPRVQSVIGEVASLYEEGRQLY